MSSTTHLSSKGYSSTPSTQNWIFFLFLQLITSGWLTKYTLGCVPVDYSNDPDAVRMVNTLWYLFLLKVVDLIETVFFVLRKKKNQVSFLHVYHHISTIILAWVGVKYLGGGMATFPVLCNCFIHVLMYSYYLAALGGEGIQKNLVKWKKTLTSLQMVSFKSKFHQLFLNFTFFFVDPILHYFGPCVTSFITNMSDPKNVSLYVYPKYCSRILSILWFLPKELQ